MIVVLGILGMIMTAIVMTGGLILIGCCVWKHVEDAYESEL